MRRTVSIIIATAAVLVLAAPAAAGKPIASCPGGESAFALVGQQAWWDATVAGFEAEGISVYVGGDPTNGFTEEFDQFAADYGFGDGQGLYDFVWIDQWAAIDKNDDLLVCMKDRPITPGNTAFYFTGTDNTAH